MNRYLIHLEHYSPLFTLSSYFFPVVDVIVNGTPSDYGLLIRKK